MSIQTAIKIQKKLVNMLRIAGFDNSAEYIGGEYVFSEIIKILEDQENLSESSAEGDILKQANWNG